MTIRRAFTCLTLITIVLSACSGRSKATPTRLRLPTFTPTIALPSPTPLPADTPAWFREAVLYEIFTPSFYDSDGDGAGDLNGIAQQLGYLDSLGVTALRLTPMLDSANLYGYDIVDYLSIEPGLGTQQDLIALVEAAHGHGMRVIMDFVATYTSDQHSFFLDAHGNKDSSYSNWYLWQNVAQTAYQSYGNNRTLPLLNLENPVVQTYLAEVMRYWIDLDNDGDLTDGIDGFHFLDADAQTAPHEFWKALRDEVKKANPDILLVGEAWKAEPDELVPFLSDQFDAIPDYPTYHILFGNQDRNGDGLLNNRGQPASLAAQLDRQAEIFPTSAQVMRFASNRNTNRIASETGGNLERQKQTAALILTLPGTPTIYYGEEIGMKGDRGNRQAPMDWDAVEGQNVQEGSLLESYRLLIAQRRDRAALSLGGFQVAEAIDCDTCLAYWRWDRNDLYLILLNLGNETKTTTIDFTTVPRPARGPGENVLGGGAITVPSNKRLTMTIQPLDTRIFHWGQP